MITSIKEFRLYLEDYQAKPGEIFKNMPADRLRNLALRTSDNTSIDSMATIAKDDTNSKPVKNIKAMPEFKRVIYNDANPKNIKGIDFGPLDVVYEMDIRDIGIYSNWLADKEVQHQNNDVKPSNPINNKNIKGEAIYYGWNAADEHTQAYYFVTLTTTTSTGISGFPFRNIHELRSAEEMYDVIWALLDAVDDVRKSNYEVDLNPDSATNGRISDEADYFS